MKPSVLRLSPPSGGASPPPTRSEPPKIQAADSPRCPSFFPLVNLQFQATDWPSSATSPSLGGKSLSPLAPPPAASAPSASPSPSSSPAPAPAADLVHEGGGAGSQNESTAGGGGGSGLSGGQKAGIAFGVLIGAGAVGLGAFVYKKRQDTHTSTLVAAYARIPTTLSLGYAARAFHLSPDPTLFMYNSLIRAHSSAGSAHQAIHLFLSILTQDLLPDHFTFPPLLTACARASAFSEGTQLHAFLLKMGDTGGVAGDIFINNTLLYFYSERGEMDYAQQVFDGMTHRNVVSWTSLIDGYARGESPRTAVSLFEDMVREGGVRPNVVTMACVVSACAKLRDLETGERVHAFVVDSGVDVSVSLVNSFVAMYMKCGAVEVAERLFSECVDRNLVLWNTMMSNYVRQGMAEKALGVLSEMLAFGVTPDRVSIIAAVSALAQLGEVVHGKQLHGYIVRNGFDGWDAVRNSVIDMYLKCGEPGAAYIVFNGMMHKTNVSWNTILAGCIRKGDLDAAWGHFDLMPERDLISWNTMIGGLVQNSCFEEAVVLFRALQVSGVKPDRVTMLGTALVDMFAKCGDSKILMQVFDNMQSKDVSTWTAAIGAMASEGNGKRALEIFDEMITKGVKPDGVVFVGLLTACSHGGLVEEGRGIFRLMSKNYGLSPLVVHYGCMVDLLGRAGLLEEAQALIEGMPMEPNDVIWGALLSASRIHHDLSLAEYAAKKMIALAPERSGSHVLLSNTYAFDGKWLDVAKVRLSLIAKGIKKLPGLSLIEVDGTIHEFTSSNESRKHKDKVAQLKTSDVKESRVRRRASKVTAVEANGVAGDESGTNDPGWVEEVEVVRKGDQVTGKNQKNKKHLMDGAMVLFVKKDSNGELKETSRGRTKGCSQAEVELEMESQIESKNFEIARLSDRLQYYEAANRE